ncbi:MAG: CPBP family intramembrane glutamic endopeptidase [Treponemataceae bacterium]
MKHEYVSYNYSNIFPIIVSISILAVFEEIIYRDFLPNVLTYINSSKKIIYTIEAFSVILFALAHLYAGFAAVFFAFISGIALRFLTIKAGIQYSCIVHASYNLTSFFLLNR